MILGNCEKVRSKILNVFTTFSRVSAAAIIILCLFSPAFAYSGGPGTETEPYQIDTVADWQELMNTSSHWDKYFVMIADVNLYGVTLTPVGNSTTQFTGIFDGNGHIIRNVVINQPSSDCVGLFGYLGRYGLSSARRIRNLSVENVNITGGIYVGGLVGFSFYGTISNCYSAGSVVTSSSDAYAGGLAGCSRDGKISNCYSASSVVASSSAAYAGGLVGYVDDSRISDCYSTGDVNAIFTSNYAGGLVGYTSSESRFSDCYSTSVVIAPASHAGGLIGLNSSSSGISNCFWDTETSGLGVGIASGSSTGVVGKMTEEMKTLSTFTDANWDISDVNGRDSRWFMCEGGDSYPKITYFVYCGHSDTVPLLGDGTGQNPYQIGSPTDLVTLSQYGTAWSKDFILTDDLNMNGFSLRPIGNTIIKFTGSFNGQGFVIHNMTINLPNKDYVGLFGAVDSNGLIENLGIEDVNIVGKRFVGGLAGSLSYGAISGCYSTGLVAGNSAAYVGGLAGVSYNGTISNCYSTISASGAGATIGGLVGCNWTGSTISNCSAGVEITDIDPNEFGSYTGGLVGSNYGGTIVNCLATGNVLASSPADISISGLVGDSSYGTISNCYATGSVQVNATSSSATICGGGLIGLKDNGDVNNCYSMGNISYNPSSESSYYLGGQVGFSYFGLVSNCYSTGKILGDETGDSDYFTGGFAGLIMGGEILRCFWDVETSEIERGFNLDLYCPGTVVNISSKTTEQMQNASTYVNVGWDFDYDDGDDADWFIQIDEYPILTWQISPADIYTDGRNDMKDFAVFAQYWMREDCAIHNNCDRADMDLNGYVDTKDFSEFLSYWLESGIY